MSQNFDKVYDQNFYNAIHHYITIQIPNKERILPFLKNQRAKTPANGDFQDFHAPPIRANVVNATSDFEKIGKGTIRVKEVLGAAIKAYPKFCPHFWKYFLIFSLLTAIFSAGVYFGLTQLESHFIDRKDSITWRATVFSIFVLELTLYSYLFSPVMLTSIQKVDGLFQYQDKIKLGPGFFIKCFFLSIIFAFLAWVLSLIHILLSLPVFLLAAFAYPAMAKYKHNPLQAFLNSVLVIIRNPIAMAVLTLICILGSFIAGKIVWSFATWLNFQLGVLWVACLPLLPWLPFVALIHAKSFTQGFVTNTAPFKRVF